MLNCSISSPGGGGTTHGFQGWWRVAGLPTVVIVCALALAGCGEGPKAPTADPRPTATTDSAGAEELLDASAFTDTTNVVLSAGMQANPLESTNVLRVFSARGVIREISAASARLVVRHEEIPGFMPKMTMPFNVRFTNELDGLAPGDAITFLVKADKQKSWIEGIKPSDTNEWTVTSSPDPSSVSLLQVGELKTGNVLPDVELLAEDGRAIKFSDFDGRVVAFTFIFTRCPLPDYCPRMNQHFGRTRELLLQRAGSMTNYQFLSISFDPEFDQPGVLSRYAFSYRGQNTNHWLFASAANDVMASMVPLLDFRFAREGGTFLHNLRTVVLDPKRRVHRQFDGSKWSAEDLAQAMEEAARRTE